jgi:mRNA-degrading endonuclease toxin of MazEF toxin-antitoxin module
MVLSNGAHIAAETGRVLVCPFVDGHLQDDDSVPFVVRMSAPAGTVLPELTYSLPASALGRYLGTAEAAQVAEVARLVTALITP